MYTILYFSLSGWIVQKSMSILRERELQQLAAMANYSHESTDDDEEEDFGYYDNGGDETDFGFTSRRRASLFTLPAARGTFGSFGTTMTSGNGSKPPQVPTTPSTAGISSPSSAPLTQESTKIALMKVLNTNSMTIGGHTHWISPGIPPFQRPKSTLPPWDLNTSV